MERILDIIYSDFFFLKFYFPFFSGTEITSCKSVPVLFLRGAAECFAQSPVLAVTLRRAHPCIAWPHVSSSRKRNIHQLVH